MNYIFLIVLVSLGFSLVQGMVRNNFVKYNKVANARGVSGAEIAQAISDHFGLGVQVGRSKGGPLSDHYDPRTKQINLSAEVYDGRSVSAAAIAAHEMGHAQQHAENYSALAMRNSLFPIVNLSSAVWMWVLIAGIAMQSVGLQTVGIVLFGAVVLFQLITLPVEFNASRRAESFLTDYGIISQEQLPGAQAVLKSAGYTYVVAALASLAQLAYFLGGRRR
ncbi:MAG: zinc metallopeptidase [Tissierellia bacterium]|jgi:Zn-dependent membrane protease YugP|nr:zinc metallopeptidase [Tissierellia bacterium]